MKTTLVVVLGLLLFTTLGSAQNAQRDQASPKSTDRIAREVRHELLMLPYLGVFDNLMYKVDGGTVTLMGQVVRPSLKDDAARAVKNIEGVEKVDNQIEVLPPSTADDRIRIAVFEAIYRFPSLQKYALVVQKPIRIIVKNGHVTLEGVVDNQTDKDTAGIRAKSVPGIFSVDNNLRVGSGS